MVHLSSKRTLVLLSFSRSEESARKAHINLNGEKLQCGENSVTLYLSYVDSGTWLLHWHQQLQAYVRSAIIV